MTHAAISDAMTTWPFGSPCRRICQANPARSGGLFLQVLITRTVSARRYQLKPSPVFHREQQRILCQMTWQYLRLLLIRSFLFLFFPFLANSSGFDHYSELFIGKFRTIFIRHHRSVFQCFKHFYLFFSQWNGKIEFMFNEHNPFVFCFSCIPCRDPCQANMLGISVFSSSCHPRP